MCTVSYLPQKEGGYIFTSNRDESPLRATQELRVEQVDKGKILFPLDSKGGSWFLTSDFGWLICVLNGAFQKHRHNPPYKISRGLMCKAVFEFPSQVDFLANYDFTGIEPFTMIMIENEKLREFRWDGRIKQIKQLSIQKRYVWYSWTLYNREMQQIRNKWFDDWSQNHLDITSQEVHALHRFGGIGDPNIDFVMNRNNRVCTVSISQYIQKSNEGHLYHYDLIHDKKISKSFFQFT